MAASEYARKIKSRDKESGSGSHEDLLVFGYSCKLFRDNDKALYLDKGHHLIPWMGDSSVMVDRYDVRGALYDLSEAEAVDGGDRLEGLTEEELAEEERCDYERYLALYQDELQHQAAQDEEAKRLMAELGSDIYTYSQVGYNYDGQVMAEVSSAGGDQVAAYPDNHPQPTDEPDQDQDEDQVQGYMPDEDENVFVPPPELNVPQGMVVPETVKQNKIIVKTSKFIVTQGAQMEILIKTKQAGNPMFGFLSFDNPLNAYYKHMVAMIKSGRYTPADEVEVRSRKGSESNSDQYLHPSLSAGIKPDLAPGTPTSALKPSSDCAYFKLIHKIKEQQKNTAVVESRESPAPASPGVPPTSTPIAEASETPKTKPKIKSEGKELTVSKVMKQLVDYPSFNRTKDYDSDSDSNTEDDEGSNEGPSSKSSSEYSNIKWPPPDVQMVIDKMASYIIKNGVEFETMVRTRDDPRFSFLKKDHEYYPYYRCKIRLYSEVYGDIFKDGKEDKGSPLKSLTEGGSTTKKEKKGGSSSSSSNNNSKQPSTISFSIKSREQDVNLDRRSTFPVESSSSDDEDLDEEEKEKKRQEREERRRKRKLKEKEERERREKEERERREREEKEREKEKEKVAEMEESTDGSGNGDDDDMYDIFKYAQEMDQDIDSEEQNHKDKGSSVDQGRENGRMAGDGLGSPANSSHSEHKQQERRKKAAMFLSRLKKGVQEEENPAQPIYGPQLPPEIALQMLKSASQSPQSSLGSARHSRSRSASPGGGIPMPPKEAPAPPPPPPPAQSPPLPAGDEEGEAHKSNKTETAVNILSKNDWSSIPEPPPQPEAGEHTKAGAASKESSVVSGASEDGRRSQSLETKRSKSRPVEAPPREKTRSRKKQRHGRSESRSPSSRRDRKKRKRSRSRTHRHKKRRSRSRSPKPHKSSHKKKRRKHSSRHDREGRERKSKKSRRRSISSSSSESSSRSTSSSRSSSPSDNDVQVIELPGPSKRESRASSVISGASDLSHRSSALGKIAEECPSPPPPLPPIPPSPAASANLLSSVDDKAGNSDSVLEVSGSGGEEVKEEKKEEKKPLFDPQNSAAMAKITMGLRAKVHALLNKESKL